MTACEDAIHQARECFREPAGRRRAGGGLEQGLEERVGPSRSPCCGARGKVRYEVRDVVRVDGERRGGAHSGQLFRCEFVCGGSGGVE